MTNSNNNILNPQVFAPAQLNNWNNLNGKPFITCSTHPTVTSGADFGPDSYINGVVSTTGGQLEANNYLFGIGGGICVLINNQTLVITPGTNVVFIQANQLGNVWSSALGTPFVTVSAIGINSGAVLTNNGANYGPDTIGTLTNGIQEACNSGNPVYLLPGTFTITTNIIPVANQVIQGSGKGVTIVFRAAQTNNYMFNCFGITGNTICNMTLDTNSANQTSNALLFGGLAGVLGNIGSNDLTVSNCSFLNGLRAAIGIDVTNAQIGQFPSNVRIINNDIYQLSSANSGNDDITTIVSSGGVITGNYISVYAEGGIEIYESNNLSCYGNTIDVNGQGSFATAGIYVASSYNCPVFGNTIRLNYINTNGIYVYEEFDNTNHRAQTESLIYGNEITWTGTNPTTSCVGIAIANASNTVIRANTFNNLANVLNFVTGTTNGNTYFVGNTILGSSPFVINGLNSPSEPTFIEAFDNVGYNYKLGVPATYNTTGTTPSVLPIPPSSVITYTATGSSQLTWIITVDCISNAVLNSLYLSYIGGETNKPMINTLASGVTMLANNSYSYNATTFFTAASSVMLIGSASANNSLYVNSNTIGLI